jgi:hypothetical protein
MVFDGHLIEQSPDYGAGPMLFEAELGMLVKIPADLDHPGQEIPRRRKNVRGRFQAHRATIA